jgi:hypothetical protein
VIRDGAPHERPGPRDPCRLSRPENQRGFALTAAYLADVDPTAAVARSAPSGRRR